MGVFRINQQNQSEIAEHGMHYLITEDLERITLDQPVQQRRTGNLSTLRFSTTILDM
jgi:hypothetical protein